MLWYQDRVRLIQHALEWIHAKIGRIDDIDVGYTLALFHTVSVLVVYTLIVATKSPLLLFVCFLFILTQFILNLVDNGCILMKIERKYLGKDWYGFYTLIGDFIGLPMTKKRVIAIYYSNLVSLTIITIYKYYIWFMKWMHFVMTTYNTVQTYILNQTIISFFFRVLKTFYFTFIQIWNEISTNT